MSKRARNFNLLEKCKETVFGFFEEQKQFKQVQSSYDELKAQFYSDMEELFETEHIGKSISFKYTSFADGELEVNRVQKSSVTFDADKLEKALSKDFRKDVILKKYEIVDMFGLVAYLKECGVDPKIFKSFLHVTKTVDVKELERLEETGKVSIEQLEGCYTIKYQKPYFTVGFKKWRGEND